MKKIVERGKELSTAMIAGVRRAIDPPADAKARPLDIRRLVLEAVETQVEPIGAGRRMLPGELVRVRVLVVDAASQKAMTAALSDIRKAATERLRELRCKVPPNFDVIVSYVRKPQPTWADGQVVEIRLETGKGRSAQPAKTPVPEIELTIVRGKAEKRIYCLETARITIGRGSEPTDQLGRSKHNDIAFIDDTTAENQTVTRVHASIRFDPETGEFRLFDEGSANGTVIIREKREIEVHRRDPVGTVILNGDEVRLGRAALRVSFQ